jgi:hypothetical protein
VHAHQARCGPSLRAFRFRADVDDPIGHGHPSAAGAPSMSVQELDPV